MVDGAAAGTTRTRTRDHGDGNDAIAWSTPASWWTFRGFWTNVLFFWRTSLPFRTITLSVALTTATVLSVGLVMSNTIASNLFEAQLAQTLAESHRATTQAQEAMDSGVETDAVALNTLLKQALEDANQAAPNAIGYAFYASTDSPDQVLQDQISPSVADQDLITPELRQEVSTAESGVQHYQSRALVDADGEVVPAIVVGTRITVQGGGAPYQLYYVYSLQETQRSLDFVQRTLVGSMIVLVLIIAVITGFVMRAVIQPIRLAAQTSRKLAAGHLEERIPEQGEDDIATLGRSFNDMADSLQEQIEQLAHLSKVQQRFVSDVSHELRTPLTTIRLAGTMLFDSRDDFDPITARSVELLHDQIERFELLLSDLLEISRFDAGAVELLREENNLVELCDEVIGSMTPVALDHGSELVLLAPGGYGDSEFDRRRVARVVRNLLGNAIEHGEGRPIVIRVDSNETAVAVSVRDYGVGMSEQQVERAFDRFWRADPSRKRTMGGSGLGLAISAEDVALHDGRLEVWSRLGRGSNFLLTLPRHVGEPVVTSPLPLEPPDAGATTFEVPSDSEAFAAEDVDTQPIILPTLDGLQAARTESIEIVGDVDSMATVPADTESRSARTPRDPVVDDAGPLGDEPGTTDQDGDGRS
ncbi:HAMP domain-containing histidine kinase [Pseudoclavibacter chungangensis]|uniref:Sensor histidine kinase MtrB n=1 Tax=Pseudoclavibacter chungangensis TaxID=587635 RepID=A0A7J5C181_9MICO|nr:MtrAB system histidine kinase MtrB [Pseudoclavibacter chungangensis]KAB1659501.1 HAMP domain-containing histidine kinase [Pseudoclavibacter chungangensis]NYJ67640.1 two-component system sensor histidine kinase MtrB [Pseudoclavibacter chungangensis]